jgi:hypothetical protein
MRVKIPALADWAKRNQTKLKKNGLLFVETAGRILLVIPILRSRL